MHDASWGCVGLARVLCRCNFVPQIDCVDDHSSVESDIHRSVDGQSRRRSVLDVGGVHGLSSLVAPEEIVAIGFDLNVEVSKEIPHCPSLKFRRRPTLMSGLLAGASGAGA